MWLASPDPAPPFEGQPRRFDVAIAIPARNEAGSIVTTLAAIDAAAARAQPWLASLQVVVSANNCTDTTAAVAARYPAAHFELVVETVKLAAGQAHAGGARRAALDTAAQLLPETGILATTDADSVVAPDWLEALLGEFARGADAVAGAITLDAEQRLRLPPLPGRDAEWRLATLMARIEAVVDPCAHDPAPRHIWAWGANLALTAAAYRTVGGMPAVPLAEDRALAEQLLAHDLKLRRSTAPLVYTSARVDGRAPGGFADLIRGFADDCEAPCDAALEPIARFVRRLRWRARLRSVHRDHGAAAVIGAARPLLGDADALPATPCFGALWAAIEQASPQLHRHRLLPSQLPGELRAAERLLARFKPGAERRVDSRVAVPAG